LIARPARPLARAVQRREGNRQQEGDNRKAKKPPQAEHPHQPDQDKIDGKEPVERLAPTMPCRACRRRKPRPVPERLDRDEQKPEAECEGDEALRVI